jgi:curli biogenesis system outer membrane secretion channel CsgG
MKAIYRFNFARGIKRATVKSSIDSAFSIAECFYTKAQMKISSAGYHLSEDGSWCFIDASDPVGEFVAQALVGMLIDTLGSRNFKVQKIEQEEELSQLIGAQT